MAIGRRIATELERMVYAAAGLPIAIRPAALQSDEAATVVRRAFARHYWRPRSLAEALELAAGLLVAPVGVPLAALWFTARNGPVIRRREGKGLAAQFGEQLRLYASAGIVGPWYYIFSLHRDGQRRAPTLLQRSETKRGVYELLKTEGQSPIGDKKAFARLCADAGLRNAGCLVEVGGSEAATAALPDCDLFVKPSHGCGGKGAERWDRVGERRWSNGTLELDEPGLLDHLRTKRRPLVVQERIGAHPELVGLTSGALPTIRAVTCLDENGKPEVVATVFRMSIGDNRTVDNFHAGGIACAVSLDEGVLGIASDLGSDARLGWHRHHPTNGALIEGTRLPYWPELKALAVKAHEQFADRVIVGWDIAIAEDGPIVIEANRGPDLDIVQRFMELGFCHVHRFTELLAHHLKARGWAD
jgi:Sugar-transfer associated ATP-grasp